MRHRIKFAVLGLFAGAALACSTPETVITTTAIPTAGLRFINAVPDSSGASGMDFRAVDIVENSDAFRILFRNTISTTAPFISTQAQFKPATEGSRHFRVFLDDTIQSIASTVLKDTTIALVATHNYTAMMYGAGRGAGADKMSFKIWDETVADPGTLIALRVVNTTSLPIDVRIYTQGGTLPGSASGTDGWSSVPAYSASTYITKPAGSYMFNVQPAGGGANMFADALALQGAAATVDIEAAPGTAVAGSAVSAFVFPRSTAGTRTPQTAAFAVPAIGFVWDRRPPRTCSPLC
jgi:hypothetical protein